MDTKTTPATVEELRQEVARAQLRWLHARSAAREAREYRDRQIEALRLAEQREAEHD